MKALQILVVCLLLSLGINAQKIWTDVQDPGLEGRVINPSKSRVLAIDFSSIQAVLMTAPMENTVAIANSSVQLSMPMPNGDFEIFAIVEAPVMAEELTAKFPSIRSFRGVSISKPGLSMRCDISHHGFHAIFHDVDGTSYIDPLTPKNLDFVQAYTRTAFYETNTKIFEESEPVLPMDFNIDRDAYEEAFDKNGKKVKKKVKPMGMPNGFAKAASGTELRTYRLALSGTGEYTAFHGGTVGDGIAAMNTSMTRVNFVYEREVAIRMVIIGNNNLLVYTDGATDPFTNGDGGVMLNENQTTCDNVIGSANYDIGHVYSTGGGGIAQLYSPCSGSKARGVTGQGAPINDPFDIDYVAHEMGHQFGGNHTQNNSCNRSTNAAFEPGSASTIMGYAGICAPNLQSNSDAYFHNHSYNEIISFSQNAGGNTCPVITNTGNAVPTVSIPAGGWVIPASTPFELTASGSDADGDVLTFNWEEYDLGPTTSGGSLATASGTQPIFRSWTGTTDPTRTFPRLSNLLNNTVPVGELLPYYTREMNFRCTVRDNQAAGGGVNDAQLTFDVSDAAGPFIVNAPNTNVTWPGLTVQTVTWDVANTDAAPVNCSTVDIYLSTDGGLTFPTLLVAGTANDGSQDIFVPDSPSSTARIKVKGSNNIFFDISNSNFTIGVAVGVNDNDAGMAGIASPAGDYCGDEFTPEFTIINQGALALTSLDISYDIDGGTATVINWTGNLASGATETFTLASTT
ncbi:MAG: reprolysin-like metallopeptidase, partial [Flavobacteriales bacterium]